ncbi:hypothetical protein LMG18101_05253 [Ralstonia flaminis]|uniref:Uncharacterized protein n=1 Tax=Ralstonia flaminis TaxID=3058597 RepID=A0ABN9JU17_9RALS|nr:hypothetical protein LMG18101_05253 [Ralstonia sp. LMG 18101]
MLAVPALDGTTDNSVAPVNGPPVAPSVRSTLIGWPDDVAACFCATAIGTPLTLTVTGIGADVPAVLISA